MSRQDTVYSSFIFLTNVVVAYIYEYYVYSVLFGALFITSIIVHVNAPNLYTNLLDKCVIGGIVLYGGYVFSRKCGDGFIREGGNATIATMIVFTFLATVFLYVYGFFCNKFCFSEDLKLANAYHALMHFIGSFGHHLIVLL
jgi:hypothetical protein